MCYSATGWPGHTASILRLGKGTCYVSEAIAKPFKSWSYGQPMSEL